MRIPASLAAAAAALMLLGCHRDEQPARAGQPPIILISVDTLRSDRVGHGLTPHVDQLGREGTSFERAFSHVPETFPSHTTIMTGLLPQNNGVRDNIGYTLDPKVPTLASVLKEHGYATGAAVSSYVLRRATGIDHGFDSYDDELEYRSSLDVEAERNGEHTTAALEHWLDGVPSHKVFAFLHIYEPHAPYDAPAEYAKGRSPYDAEVAYADAIVGKFLDDLKRRGLYDEALIVFLSDHGEGLGDHGEDEHGVLVYREAIQVPLIVKLPHAAGSGQRVHDLAALTDVMPTILAAAGIDAPKTDGVNLLSGRHTSRQLYVESYFPRLHVHWHELTSLIDDHFQFIDAPKRELYDHGADPTERQNLVESNRRTAFGMADTLKPLVRFQPPSAVDEEDQRKLAALGYIGSVSTGAGGDYPDPKDRIQYVRMFRQAQRLPDAQAIPLLQKLTRENPSLVDEWAMLAGAYERTGRRALAIATLHEANKLFPGSPSVTLPLAQVLLSDKRYAEARAHAELALKQDPVLAHEMLSQIAFVQGDGAAARREIDLALSGAPHRTTTLMQLARIQEKGEDWTGALATLDGTAGEVRSRHLAPMRDLEAQRGQALLHLGRGPEAEQAFRAEIASFPDNLPAWGNLAVILAVEGHRDEAMHLLAEAKRKNPGPAAERMVQETLDAVNSGPPK
jgi:arylsulfatase A-like enzyme/Flp pilus assembly protein TadD